MKLLVEFDINGDIIDVPQFIIDNKDRYASKFYQWLSDKRVHHSYWIKGPGGMKCLCYRSDAFVEWLNKKVLKESNEKAVILEQFVAIDEYIHLPSIFF